ncbi:MAG: hypothetical protein Q4B21_02660 [Bacteroidia bacterium]|nr:hypothetical protein [Bacteroidia bacterium]
MTHSDFNYMKEAMTADLAELLAKDYKFSVTESLDAVYGSETYSKLCDPNTGLYYQSTQYVYSFLKNEITNGYLS